jgi:signal transduction histidine kinase
MRLADFIRDNIEAILVEWEAFASTLLPVASDMTSLALRDHAPHILEAVAKDITTSQTAEEQSEKSKGRSPIVSGAPETAAQTHAILRAYVGFDIKQLVAEYRAMRASVLRLWIEAGPLDQTAVIDMLRFNEAIDQAVAESVGHFHSHVERARNLLLGMLGHDMRSPLSAILTTSNYLSALNAGDQVSAAAARLIRSGESMQALLNDLVDFNRTNLGLGLKVVPSDINLAGPVAEELEQLRWAHSSGRLQLTVSGDCRGEWDGVRIQQVLRNLVSNAFKYGTQDTPVRVALRGEEGGIWLEVTNSGPPINSAALDAIFDPLKRGPASADGDDRGSLGLGLFIVREIARAHGGEVQVRSDREETTFAVHLPRHKPDMSVR